MSKIVLAIGLGPNDLEIPLLVFQSKEQGKEYLTPILGTPTEDDEEIGWDTYELFDGERDKRLSKAKTNEESNVIDEEFENLYKKIFKKGYYYGGCGSCHTIVLREVEFATPLVKWDLD